MQEHQHIIVPVGPKSRANCPRPITMTKEDWDCLLDQHKTMCSKGEWDSLAKITKLHPHTIRTQWRVRNVGSARSYDLASSEEHPLTNTDWTMEEMDILTAAVDKGKSPSDTAAKLGRTVIACQEKYKNIRRGHVPTPAVPRLPTWSENHKKQKREQAKTNQHQRDIDAIRVLMVNRSATGIAAILGWTVPAVESAITDIENQ